MYLLCLLRIIYEMLCRCLSCMYMSSNYAEQNKIIRYISPHKKHILSQLYQHWKSKVNEALFLIKAQSIREAWKTNSLLPLGHHKPEYSHLIWPWDAFRLFTKVEDSKGNLYMLGRAWILGGTSKKMWVTSSLTFAILSEFINIKFDCQNRWILPHCLLAAFTDTCIVVRFEINL